MSRYRATLPQLGSDLFLTDGGLETTLVFHEGWDLPEFAAFHLLRTREGAGALRRYFTEYVTLARRCGTGLILDAPTWRASTDWGARLGYAGAALEQANREAVRLLEEVRSESSTDANPVVISGCLGPRGDAYVAAREVSAEAARDYHQRQIDTFADTGADMVSALTLNRTEEAVGIAQAARRAGMPVVLSFTLETDGRLPDGQTLREAIERVDEATDGYPCYFMINCAHPTHFQDVLRPGEAWADRIRGLRANASRLSHAELDQSTELDAGDPVELGRDLARMKARLPRLNVLGGCCGTDTRHIERIAMECRPLFGNAP